MTTLCLKPKIGVESETWYQIFSNYITEVQSLIFMKQLTSTCVSTILHLRKIIPNTYFEPKNFEGMTLMLFKFGQGYKVVEQIEKWLKGAFEAIDKKYLKSLMLDIKDAKSNTTLEIYTMTFNYLGENDDMQLTLFTDKNKSLNQSCCITVNDTESKTIKLLEMCYAVTTGLSPLPKQITLAIRLSYYKNTPEDYQPNGYQALESSNIVFLPAAKGMEIGIIGTNYHMFKLVGKSCFSDEFFKKLNDLQQEETIKTKKEISWNKSSLIPRETFTKPTPIFNGNNKNRGRKFKYVRCPCKATENTKMMFTCYNCKCWVHSECYGVKEFYISKKIRFFCNYCHKPEINFVCHDKVLLNLKNSIDQQKLAVLRRLLTYCDLPQIKKISLKKLEKISGQSSLCHILQTVLKKMIRIGVIVPQERRKFFKIDKTELKKNLIHYFYKSSFKSDQKQVKFVAKIRKPSKRKDTVSLNLHVAKKKAREEPIHENEESQKSPDSVLQHSSDLFN